MLSGCSAFRGVVPLPSWSQRSTRKPAQCLRNAWNNEFAGRVAFADMSGQQTAWTGDRTEFFGRNGTPDHPASLERGDRFSGKVGAGPDPCAALQTMVELRAGGRAEIVFFLGEAPTMKKLEDWSRSTAGSILMGPCARSSNTGMTFLVRCR